MHNTTRPRQTTPFSRALALLLIVLVAVPGSVFGHAEEPGEPIMVSATIDEGIVQSLDGGPANFDDGWDLEAEFMLTTTFFHFAHATEVSEAGTYANTSASPILDLFDYYSHPECTQRNYLLVISNLIEVDTEVAEHVMIKWMQLGAGLALSGYGAPAAVAIFTGGLVAHVAAGLNGADDFGTVAVPLPTNSTTLMEFKGTDGAATLPLTGREVPTWAITCGSWTSVASVTVADRVKVFDEARDAMRRIPGIQAEAGNPAGLSEQDLDDLRAAFDSMIVNGARLHAAFEVEAASGFAGDDEAVAFFGEAEAAAEAGDGIDAIELYATAFEVAARAIEDAEDGSGASIEPRLVPLTAAYATREGRSFDLPIVLVGLGVDAVLDTLEVQGLPKTATWTPVTTADGRVVSIRIELGDSPPGHHELDVTASGSNEETSTELSTAIRLAIGAAPFAG